MLYLCQNLEDVKKATSQCKGKGVFLFLQNKEDLKIKSYVSSLGRFEYLNKFELIDNKIEALIQKTKHFLAELNTKATLKTWWALSLSTKLPIVISSKLPYNILNYLAFIEILKNGLFKTHDNVILIADELCVLSQVRLLLIQEKMPFDVLFRQDFKRILKSYFPFGCVGALLKAIFLKGYASLFFRNQLDQQKQYTVIQSLISLRSFQENQYIDVNFGKLYEILQQNVQPVFILASVFSPILKVLRNMGKQRSKVAMIPMAYFCSWKNFLLCFGKTLKRHYIPFPLAIPLKVDGFPVDILVRSAERDECLSAQFFSNLLPYYCTLSLTKHLNIHKFYYIFENRAWERSMILGLRKAAPEVKLIGYQHSSISSRQWNYSLAENEVRARCPLPDVIYTCGVVTRDHLLKHFALNPQSIKLGCFLKSDAALLTAPLRKKPIQVKSILYALASSYEEHYNAFSFFERVPENLSNYTLIIRPAPLLSIERILKMNSWSFKFAIDSARSIRESLKSIDVFLYSSTTACLEALAMGIPVVYVKLADFCDTDPLSQFHDFKWRARSVQELIAALQNIDAMSHEQFERRQQAGRDYVSRYLYPVNENNLKIFLS